MQGAGMAALSRPRRGLYPSRRGRPVQSALVQSFESTEVRRLPTPPPHPAAAR